MPPLPIDPVRGDLAPLPARRRTKLRGLLDRSSTPTQVSVDPQSGRIVGLLGTFGEAEAEPRPTVQARAFLRANAAQLGLPRGLRGFRVLAAEQLGDISRVRVQQQVGTVPVFASGVVVDVNAAGQVVRLCSNVADVGGLGTTPKIGVNDAAATARQALGIEADLDLPGTLVVLDRASLLGEQTGPELAWKFEIDGPDGTQQVMVNASTNSVSLNVHTPVEVGENPTSCPFNPVPQYHLNEATGVPDFVTFGPRGLLLPESTSGDAVRVALGFFERYPLMFGTGDVPNQLRHVRTEIDSGSPHQTHVVLQQVWAGLPVFGCELRVHLTPALAVSSISGNYLRDPRIVPVPSVAEEQARSTAMQAIATLRGAWNGNGRRRRWERPRSERLIPRDFGTGDFPLVEIGAHDLEMLDQVRAEIRDRGLCILPTVLSREGGGRNHLAYRFETWEAELFVSAESDEIVFAIPSIQRADRLIYDANGGNELSFPMLVVQNGTPVNGATLNADAAGADPLVLRTLSFYANLGRSSWNGGDRAVAAVSNAGLVFSGCPNAFFDPFRGQMWFCLGELDGDVLAHEFTHGVTFTTARLLPLDEQGALNEHYSDVMGVLCFPDATPGAWVLGEAGGFSRDLANPTVANYAGFLERGAGCTSPLDPLTNRGCDAGFVHSNCGIGNRAAVFLADGDGTASHPGIGRDRLGRLFFETLTKRMHPWSTYLDEVHNTWETARIFAAAGTTVLDTTTAAPDDTIDFAGVANEVMWAFAQVGVDQRLLTGWFQVGGGLTGGRGTVTFNAGETLPTGFTVADVELIVTATFPGGTPWWTGRSRVSAGGTVAFPGGIFGASVIAHGIGTASKQVDVRYFHSGFIPMGISVALATAGATPLPTQISFVSPTRAHWDVGVGGRGDDTINAGITLQGGMDAQIDDVEVELLDRDGNVLVRGGRGDPVPVVRYGLNNWFSWGAQITSDGVGTRSEEVVVHWWFDVGVANRYRLRYYASGTNVAPG